MSDPEPRLDILVADADAVSAAAIAAAFGQGHGVTSVGVAHSAEEARDLLAGGKANALVVDIFSLGVIGGVKLIESTRELHPEVPICLLGTNRNLREMPVVPNPWRKRFGHYHKLVKDQPPEFLRKETEVMANKLFAYWLARSAKVRLTKLRAMLVNMKGKTAASPEDKQEISDLDFVDKALDAKDNQDDRPVGIIPGFEARDIQALVNQTLDRASRSLDRSTKTNTGILLFGAALISLSLLAAYLKPDHWEPVVFGGFGLAGMVASLITQPLRSIGAASRQIVQIQVAYLGFLNQIAIINDCPTDTAEAALNKSKRLQKVIQNIQETLAKNFN